MSGALAVGEEISLTGDNLTYIILAAVVALVALGFAFALVKAVLSAGTGTQKMQEIAEAVQEGASAYLIRQFKTLAIFVVIAVVLLFLLPVSHASGVVPSCARKRRCSVAGLTDARAARSPTVSGSPIRSRAHASSGASDSSGTSGTGRSTNCRWPPSR